MHTSGSTSNEGNKIEYKGCDGTGGLLVIFSNKYDNQGSIEANGVESVKMSSGVPSGGASGGGSINIFYNEFISNNKCVANGGQSVSGGGAGGNGCISIGCIASGTYQEFTE